MSDPWNPGTTPPLEGTFLNSCAFPPKQGSEGRVLQGQPLPSSLEVEQEGGKYMGLDFPLGRSGTLVWDLGRAGRDGEALSLGVTRVLPAASPCFSFNWPSQERCSAKQPSAALRLCSSVSRTCVSCDPCCRSGWRKLTTMKIYRR